MGSKGNTVRHLICLCVLCTGFVLCRYVFLDLHGMKQWPEVLFYAGLFFLFVSFCANGTLMPVGVGAGYPVGFAAGLRFEIVGADPHGGMTSNMWKIWGLVYFGLIVFGAIIDLVIAKRKRRSP